MLVADMHRSGAWPTKVTIDKAFAAGLLFLQKSIAMEEQVRGIERDAYLAREKARQDNPPPVGFGG